MREGYNRNAKIRFENMYEYAATTSRDKLKINTIIIIIIIITEWNEYYGKL